jgi:hypothetical protein
VNPLDIARFLISLVSDLLSRPPSPEFVAKRLAEAALATGLAENVLASYLTEAARARQEALFEAAKQRKLAGK